eukprot:748884-Pyramimonas_sp.AAC.2
MTSFVFTGPPVPVTARVRTPPQMPIPFSHPVSSSPLPPTSLPLGLAILLSIPVGLFAWLSYAAYTLLVFPLCFSSALPLPRSPQPSPHTLTLVNKASRRVWSVWCTLVEEAPGALRRLAAAIGNGIRCGT